MVRMIDPPSGWKYGFPKPVPDPAPANIIEWLIGQGYPEKEILSYGEHFYCRHWETELSEEVLNNVVSTSKSSRKKKKDQDPLDLYMSQFNK